MVGYNYSMNIISTAFVSLMLLDLLQPAIPIAAPAPDSQHSETGAGTLTVVTDSMQTAGSLPRGASHVPFLTVSLSASCESEIKVSSIDLTHIGLGLSTDIASVYAVDGFTRTTRAAHFDRQRNKATLRFRSLTLPKCGAATFTLFGDMRTDSQVASEHGIVLASVTDIVSSAKRTNLLSEDKTKKVLSVSPVQTEESLTVRLLPISTRIQYGNIETVARVQLTAGPGSAHLLKSITFTNAETARDMDLQWLSLETLSGTGLTAPVPRMRGYTATLQFSPTIVLQAGETKVLNLKAEIHASVRKKINFVIEEPSDIVATPYRAR